MPFAGIGAYHGSDVYMYLGSVADIHLGNSTAKPTEAELKLSSQYMNAWVTFAEVSYIHTLLLIDWLIVD